MEPAGRRDACAREAAALSTAAGATAQSDEEMFLGHRPMLIALAYRLLGSVHEAEDVVQDAYLRWSATNRAEVANPAAFLTAVTTRLAVDRLRSATARRELYIGSWLPEPLPTAAPGPTGWGAPAESAALRESASIGMLLLLDRLGPAERAVFVLREAFDLPYAEIATILERSEASCRQLLSRARRRTAATPTHVRALDPATARPLVDAFLAAARSGDLGRLQSLLREDVTLTTDGNGTARAGRHPVHGAEKVARLLAKVFERFDPRTEVRHAWYNHAPALVIDTPVRRIVYLFQYDTEGHLGQLFAILTPEKLSHLPV